MKRLLQQPMVLPVLALVGGLLLALAAAAWLPPVPIWTVELPTWIARTLSPASHDTLVIANVAMLWLVPLAVAPYLTLVVRRSLVDAPIWHIALQLCTRLALLLALALALALPSLRAPMRGKTVVMAVDVSASMDDAQLAGAGDIVRQAKAAVETERTRGVVAADRTRLRLITYAAAAKALPLDVVSKFEHAEAPLASDHAGALRLAEALVDPDTEGRIVLVTDGRGTLGERDDLSATTHAIRDRGNRVHVRVLAPASQHDVIVEAVHLPAEIRLGQTFDVMVDVFATTTTRVELRLLRSGEANPLQPTQTVELEPGRRQVTFASRVTDAGPVVYTATLDSERLPLALNLNRQNDAAAAARNVRGRPRVLHVGHDTTRSLPRALQADHLHVDDIQPRAVPTTVEGLAGYDLVIFSDVSAQAIPSASQRALQTYVQELGGGFVMLGGESSFGLGGWNGTLVEGLLPVRFEGERQREQPKLALVLVIDKSGSMSSEDKLDLVKEAARATARTLDSSDELAVIAFDSRPQVLVQLQPAGNRIRIAGDIRRLTAGGGTNALPALREAYLQLSGSNARVKHVILLSDGQSPEAGLTSLLDDMRDAEITVSTVGVGAGAGKDLLARVAERGRGRFHYSQDGTDVPRIFSRETSEVTRNAAVEHEHFARVAKNVQALRGIDFAHAPGLRGLIPLEPKPLAEVLLRSHSGEALLVRGRSGLGRTVAFASDALPRWAARWIGWSGFAKLWSQIARDTMRQGVSSLGGASIGVEPGDGEGRWRIVVDVDPSGGFANDLRGELEVLDPTLAPAAATRTHVLPLQLAAPGRYESELHGMKAGVRLVSAKLYDTHETPRRLVAEASGEVAVPYPPELSPEQRQPPPREWLANLSSDGEIDGPIATIMDAAVTDSSRTRTEPLWPRVLWGLCIPLLILDVLARRIGLGRRRLRL